MESAYFADTKFGGNDGALEAAIEYANQLHVGGVNILRLIAEENAKRSDDLGPPQELPPAEHREYIVRRSDYWLVRFRLDMGEVSKRFGDRKYGGWDAAFEMAVAWRDEWLASNLEHFG